MRTQTRSIAAPARRVFQVLCDDRMLETEDALVTLKHITSGPLRTGFSYRRTAPHGDHRCVSDAEITKFERPWLLEERVTHVCMASARDVTLILHHQIIEYDDEAVDLVVSMRRVGGSLASRVLARACDQSTLLRVIEYVRHRAEAPASATR